MTIEDIDKLDSGGIDARSGEVVLLISDHLPWGEEREHFSSMEKKIASYLTFIRSGQIVEIFPSAKNFPIRIKLVHKYAPPLSAIIFLEAAGKRLTELGILFSHESLPSSY